MIAGDRSLAARSRCGRARKARARIASVCWRRPACRGSRRAAADPREHRRCPAAIARAGESIVTGLPRSRICRRRRASTRTAREPARCARRRPVRPGRRFLRPARSDRCRARRLHGSRRRAARAPRSPIGTVCFGKDGGQLAADHQADQLGADRPRPSAAWRRARRRAAPSRDRRSANSSSSRCEM